MRQPELEAARWIAQAESDLAFAVVGVREGFFAQACFTCQQTGEKALKAIDYASGARIVLGHSLVDLLTEPLSRHPLCPSSVTPPGSSHQHLHLDPLSQRLAGRRARRRLHGATGRGGRRLRAGCDRARPRRHRRRITSSGLLWRSEEE